MQDSNTERLRFAAELINDFIVDWNVNTDEVYLSSRWKQVLGYTDAEIPNNFEGWLMTVEPHYRESFTEQLHALRDGKIPVSMIERTALCKDGTLIWIASKAKVVDWNPDGRASRIIGVFSNINEKKLEESLLVDARNRFESLFQKHAAVMILIDPATACIIDANEAALQFYGYTYNQITRMRIQDIATIPKDEILDNFKQISNFQKNSLIVSHRLVSGEIRNVEVWTSPIEIKDKVLLYTVIHDITQEIKSKEALKNSKRFYEFTSKVNDLILYATDEAELFRQVTRIAVESGGFLFSFIGGPDSRGNTLRIDAYAGYEAGYLAILQSKFSIEDSAEGNGPSGKAIREGKHFICNDIEHDPQMIVWRDEALKRGYRSSIALPIVPEQKAEFIFTLYAGKPFSISEDEVLLLDRVAANISFALKNLRNNKKRSETEIRLKIIMQAVEQNSASVVITDIDGNIEYVNPAFCTLSGYSFTEALGQNPRILKSGYTTAPEYDLLWDQLVHHQTWSGIFCNRRKDGSLYWESAVISPILNEAGDITHYVSVKENITARKELEEDLKEKIRIIEVAQNVAQIGTYIIDLKSRTWESSAIFDQIFGLDPKFEKQMDQFYALVLPEYLKGMDAQSIMAQLHKKSFTYKFKARRKNDGQIRCLESYAIFIYDDQGNPIQLIGAIKDITEIEELIEERERILESINDYFYVLDLQMNFKYCNQAFANRYLEGNREKVIGKNIYEMFPFLKQSVLAEHLSNAINSGISDHFEIYLDFEEINPVWIEEHIYSFENGLSVLFRDISDRKVAEQNLQKLNAALQIKTQELTNSNTELERFAYVASHDLQEPLRMVSSFMQLFEKKYERLVDETGKKYIQFAVDGAERMKLLIRDLLQYSRAGSGSLEIKQVNMNVVLKEVLLLFKNEIYQVDAEIKYGNLPIIQAGKSAMIQLMQNLIGNALKYRREEKPVVEISGVETDQEWIIHIKDNGIGIEPRYFEKIFIVFQRLHNKNEYGGTGIGLSVCKKIVERYKGRIWVASEPGKGSVFSFSIPKKK